MGPSAWSRLSLSRSLAVRSWERFLLLLHLSFLSMGWGEKAVFVVLPGRGPKEGASAHLTAAAETDCARGTGQPFFCFQFLNFLFCIEV